MAEIVDLSARRAPVSYTVEITHHWDDRLEVFVHNVANDDRSRASVNDAIARVAESRMTAAHIHRAMLARIDALMGAQAGTPEARELSRLAESCQAYESATFNF